MLAAAVGRGYTGQHRLAEVALGRAPGALSSEVVVAPAAAPSPGVLTAVAPAEVVPAPVAHAPDQPVATGRASVAPWLRVVSTPPQPDPLADTLPHPVVALFPLPQALVAATPVSPAAADSAEEKVFALVDAERERTATVDLAGGADVRPYRARHTA